LSGLIQLLSGKEDVDCRMGGSKKKGFCSEKSISILGTEEELI